MWNGRWIVVSAKQAKQEKGKRTRVNEKGELYVSMPKKHGTFTFLYFYN
jgi:hypothetical protein